MRLFIIFLLAALLSMTAQPAKANIFSDASKWAKSTASKARDGLSAAARFAEHAANEAAKSSKYISEKAIGETVKFAKKAGGEIKNAVNKMKDLLDSLGGIGKSCEAVISTIGLNALEQSWPDPAAGWSSSLGLSPASVVPALGRSSCTAYQVSGFTCGIFPYLKGIVASVAQGSANTKRLAQYVGRAYNSRICKRIPALGRGECAVVSGLIASTRESASCVASIAVDIAQSTKGGGGSFGSMEKQVCTFAGEFAFGFAADSLALGGVGDSTKKLIRFAQLLRTALNAQHYVATDTELKQICEKGARVKKGEMARQDHDLNILEGPKPGSNLMLMAYINDPRCLDLNQKNKTVNIWSCHGSTNQRWTFHNANVRSQRGWLQIRNATGGANTCLTSPGTRTGKDLKYHGGYRTSKCRYNEHEQMFKVLKGGLIKNLHTGNCLNIAQRSKKSGARIIDWPCQAAANEIWYYSDPATDLIRPDPGAHLALYAYPGKPMCLDGKALMKSKLVKSQNRIPGMPKGPQKINVFDGFGTALGVCQDSPTQKWSFHTTKNKKAWDYGQIWNDKWGPKGCLTSQNKKNSVLKIQECHTQNAAQKFEILPSGAVRSLKSGMCLTIKGARHAKGTKIIEWPCLKKTPANQQWYVL